MQTDRLILRRWQDSDRAAFAALNADPEVMLHFPNTLTREQSDGFVDRIEAKFDEYGWGLYAVEVKDGPGFIGFVGLLVIDMDAHFSPATEVGWRVAKEHWGKGYATEAANRVLEHAFDEIGLKEIVSMTATANTPSRAVMERIGMTRNPDDDFDHPNLPEGHDLQRHVLYRKSP